VDPIEAAIGVAVADIVQKMTTAPATDIGALAVRLVALTGELDARRASRVSNVVDLASVRRAKG
jgi:hypothetical protein